MAAINPVNVANVFVTLMKREFTSFNGDIASPSTKRDTLVAEKLMERFKGILDEYWFEEDEELLGNGELYETTIIGQCCPPVYFCALGHTVPHSCTCTSYQIPVMSGISSGLKNVAEQSQLPCLLILIT